ncbi:NAD(P)H-dependent flavin oxidoreductase [Brevibacillus sp. H7]|uniref:NAD(P)H-dependent flavin oxidoreductase n=1 Tax=Brevibacillus sp. H7 TaxID=3349138 RepID=UPI00380E76E0
MWPKTIASQRLQIDYPIIQAGMAGGATSPQLVAAVSRAGGLGTLGAGYMTAEQIRTAIREIRRLTDRPFGVNLFLPEPYEVEQPNQDVARVLNEIRNELGLAPDPEVTRFAEPFEEQMAAVLEERVPVFSSTFGILEAEWVAELKRQGSVVIGTATTVREAKALEESGVDMVVAQGSEAGGHRGSFLPDAASNLIGTMALVPQVADAVNLPVIAAGGIMDGRGIAAALALGASAVQLGTAFLTCEESAAHVRHKHAILDSADESTVITRVFSGKPARGIRNAFMDALAPYEQDVPVYPVQNALTRDIRQAAAKQQRSDYLSMWAGQASPLSRAISAEELIQQLVRETAQVCRGLSICL